MLSYRTPVVDSLPITVADDAFDDIVAAATIAVTSTKRHTTDQDHSANNNTHDRHSCSTRIQCDGTVRGGFSQ